MTYRIKDTRNILTNSVPSNVEQKTTYGLNFVGKLKEDHGEILFENYLHILENFACPNNGSDFPNPSNPNVDLTSPKEGQLWYDTTNRKLRVWDSVDNAWKVTSGAAIVSSTPPSSPSIGDLWYNSSEKQLFSYDGASWTLIGPINSASNPNFATSLIINSGGTGGLSVGTGPAPTGGTNYDSLGILINNTLNAVFSDTEITTPTYYYRPLNDGSNNVVYYAFDPYGNNGILKGLNIGENTSTLYWFNGKSKSAETADQINGITSSNFMRNDTAAGADTSRNPATAGLNIGSPANRWSTIYANTFDGTATSALFADLAERFLSDYQYMPGTLVMFGGPKEITSTKYKDDPVFGVISTNPAFTMNNDKKNKSMLPVALIGRVPVLVKGKVEKFDYLVPSDEPGVAMASKNKTHNAFGRALESKSENKVKNIEAFIKAEI